MQIAKRKSKFPMIRLIKKGLQQSNAQIVRQHPQLVFVIVDVLVKHVLLVNTKGLGVAKLRRKPSPTYTHTFTPLNTYTKK